MPSTRRSRPPPEDVSLQAPVGRGGGLGRRYWLQAGLMLGQVAILFNAGAYITMLPRVAGSLGIPPSHGTWTQTDFMTGLALGFPLSAALVQSFGLARTVRMGYLGFAAFSWGCSTADGLPAFLACRVLLGLTGGVLLPAGPTLFLNSVPLDRRDSGLSWWGALALTPYGLGTGFGGWLAEELGWRLLFQLNGAVALGVAALAFGPEETRPRPPPFDGRGLVLSGTVLFALQTILNQGNDLDWLNSDQIAAWILVLGLAVWLALGHFRKVAHPFIHLELLAHRNLAVGLTALVLGFLCFQGLLSLLIVQLQLLLGYSPALAGWVFLPLVVAKPVASLGQILLRRVDARLLASLDLFGFALTAFWTSRYDTATAFDRIVWPKLAEGVCLGAFFAPLTAIMLHGLSPVQQVQAVQLASSLRLAAGAWGISLAGIVLYRRTPFHRGRLVEGLTPLDADFVGVLGRFTQPSDPDRAALARLTKIVGRQAGILAIDEAFWLAGWIFLVLALLVWLARPTRAAMDRPTTPRRQRRRALEELVEEP